MWFPMELLVVVLRLGFGKIGQVGGSSQCGFVGLPLSGSLILFDIFWKLEVFLSELPLFLA